MGYLFTRDLPRESFGRGSFRHVWIVPSCPDATTMLANATLVRCACSGIHQVLPKEFIDTPPCIPEDRLTVEVVEFARVHHEVDEIALVQFQSLINQADRLQVWHVHVSGSVKNQQRPLQPVQMRDGRGL